MLVNMARSLGARQYEVHVYAHGQGPMEDAFAQDQVQYHSVQHLIPWYIWVQDDLAAIAAHWHLTLQSAAELETYFRMHQIECVIMNTLTSYAALIAAARLEIPSIVWIAGILNHELVPDAGRYYKNACDHLLTSSAAAAICPSVGVKHYYAKWRKDIEVIPNFTAVPDQLYALPEGTTVFCTLNSWEHHKGADCLIETAAILKRRGKAFELHGYGRGGNKQPLLERAAQYGLLDRVFLNDSVIDVSAVYQRAHCLVSASRIESFGMTLIEAMACGRCIIVSDIPAHRAIIERSGGGWLCGVNHPEQFAAAMERVIDQREQAKERGMKGWAAVKQHYDGREAVYRMEQVMRTITQPGAEWHAMKQKYQQVELFCARMNAMTTSQ